MTPSNPADQLHRDVTKAVAAARRLARALDRIADSLAEVAPADRAALAAIQGQLAAVSHRLDVAGAECPL
jgi:hypothetical protein